MEPFKVPIFWLVIADKDKINNMYCCLNTDLVSVKFPKFFYLSISQNYTVYDYENFFILIIKVHISFPSCLGKSCAS